MIREITLYSNGNSNDISTWSNVPYLFAKSLEEKGIKVNRVDISANDKVLRLYDSLNYFIFCRLFKSRVCPTFYRTRLHRFLVNVRLWKVAKKYRTSELNLILSYFCINKYSSVRNIMWCDWTDRMVIERQNREPKWYERWSLKQEDKCVREADMVFTMFPKCRKHMEELYNREIIYLDRNVVNTVYDKKFDLEDVIENRYKSNKILFIGNIRYKGACMELIDTYNLLRNNNLNLELHIIGMTYEDLGIKRDNKGIYCYGYLNKNIVRERNLYYELLLTSKIFINPAKVWGGYSSTVEAMYYGCPIIVSPYDDFVENFGENIEFGIYHKDNSLTSEIGKILAMTETEYKGKARVAYQTVSDYTWSNYTEEFLKYIDVGKLT